MRSQIWADLTSTGDPHQTGWILEMFSNHLTLSILHVAGKLYQWSHCRIVYELNIQANVKHYQCSRYPEKHLLLHSSTQMFWLFMPKVTALWAWMEASKTVSPNKSCLPCYLKLVVTFPQNTANPNKSSMSACCDVGLGSYSSILSLLLKGLLYCFILCVCVHVGCV